MTPSLTDRLSGPGTVSSVPTDELPDPAQRVMPLRRYVVAIGLLGATALFVGGALATGVLEVIGRRTSAGLLSIEGLAAAAIALAGFGQLWRRVIAGFGDALPIVGDVHRIDPDLRGALLSWELARPTLLLAAAFTVIGLLFGGSAIQVFPLAAAIIQAVCALTAARLIARREEAQRRRYFVRIELAEGDLERDLLWEPHERR
jgi:hypothetical protein